MENPAKIIIFIIFILLAYAFIPVIMHIFIDLQQKIGNADLSLVKFLRKNFLAVTIGIWISFTIGLILGLPVMLKDGFFN